MALGMALAVAAFITVISLVLSLRDTMDDKLARYGASILVTPARAELSLEYGGMTVADVDSGDALVLDESVLTAIADATDDALVAEVVPVLVRPVDVAGETYLALGTDVPAALRAKPWWKVEGAEPAGRQEVLLGLTIRNRLGLEPGGTLAIQGQDYAVSGVLWETGGEEDGVIVMDRAELAALTGYDGINLIEVVAADSGSVERLSEEIAAAIPEASVTSVKRSLEFNARAAVSLSRFGLAATGLIVVVSASIITLTMLAAVRERRKEIGILRAMGYRRRDIWRLLLLESSLLSIGAAVVGVALGLGGAVLGPMVVRSLDLQVTISPLVVVAGMVLSGLLATVATLYPASHAARLDPATALRGI